MPQPVCVHCHVWMVLQVWAAAHLCLGPSVARHHPPTAGFRDPSLERDWAPNLWGFPRAAAGLGAVGSAGNLRPWSCCLTGALDQRRALRVGSWTVRVLGSQPSLQLVVSCVSEMSGEGRQAGSRRKSGEVTQPRPKALATESWGGRHRFRGQPGPSGGR